MPLPKRRHSKARHDTRRAQQKLATPTLVPCPHCKKPKVPHRVCPHCGYYNGREVIKIERPFTKSV